MHMRHKIGATSGPLALMVDIVALIVSWELENEK